MHPILALDLIRLSEEAIIAGIGDTSGNIQLWVLPGILRHKNQLSLGDFSTHPIYEYSGHQMGVNAIRIIKYHYMDIGNSSHLVELIIVSGGDDQALCISYISVLIDKGGCSGPAVSSVRMDHKDTVYAASSSAIKGLFLSKLPNPGNKWRVYAVGYEELLTLWEVDVIKKSIKYQSSIHADISDIECLTGFQINDRDTLIVGGQGMEIFSGATTTLKTKCKQ